MFTGSWLCSPPHPNYTSFLYGSGSGSDFSLMLIRIWILLLIEVLRICDHLSTDTRRLHFDPPLLHLWASAALHGFIFEPIQLLKFDFDADPYPAFILMQIRIWLLRIMRIRIRNTDTSISLPSHRARDINLGIILWHLGFALLSTSCKWVNSLCLCLLWTELAPPSILPPH